MGALACLFLHFVVGILNANGQINMKTLNLSVPLCQKHSAPPKSSDPPLPRLPPSFSVHVEGSIIEKSMTVTADEYVDTTLGMASLTVSKNGKVEQIIYNNNTNEVYYIKNQQCNVTNMTNNVDTALFGGYIGSSIPHAFSTQYLLDFGKKFGEPPVGVACYNRKATRPGPRLKPAFQYREEITDVYGLSVSYVDVYYDYNANLVRLDGRDRVDQPLMTHISDYNTGIEYNIDQQTKQCVIKAISNKTWGSFHNRSTIHLMTPDQLFHIDNTFAYSGQRTIRGITCDVYTKVITEYFFEKLNVMQEVYFMAKSWISETDFGESTNNADVPVAVTVKNPPYNLFYFYDLFDFDQDTPDITNSFDISLCFNDSEKINFEITYLGNASCSVFQDEKYVKMVIIATIMTTTGIGPIRIQRSSTHLDQRNMYFVATLIDRPPAVAGGPVNQTTVQAAYSALQSAVDNQQLQPVDVFSSNAHGTVVYKAVAIRTLSDNPGVTGTTSSQQTTKTSQTGLTGTKRSQNTTKSGHTVATETKSGQHTTRPTQTGPTGSKSGRHTTTAGHTGTKNLKQTTKSGQTGVKNPQPTTARQTGAIVGAAVGMLVLGILLGVGGVILFNKRRGPGPDLHVSYSNKTYSD